MLLHQALQSVATLHDLPGLVAALGHEPLWQELAPESWLAGWGERASVGGTALVGRAGGFSWFGLEASPQATVRLARWLAGRGQRVGLVALTPGGNRLALTVAALRPPLLETSTAAPDRLVLSCLARAAAIPVNGPVTTAELLVEVFEGQALGARFFQAFRDMLDLAVAGLPLTASLETRHALALLSLTRVLFLYYVQAKGWLAGSPHFLREQVERCLWQRRPLHRDLLRPLFFGCLNTPVARRGALARSLGPVPFLNGGLFDPHPLERRGRADLPNSFWRRAFDELFERYHFTVAEGADPTAVAPDMLGRVFEGVMQPDLRHASGTYYTPPALVNALVDEALTHWLAARLATSAHVISRRLASGDPTLRPHLRGIAILDPAVGSGAFLLGALERLAGLSPPASGANPRREILRRNLFGVDQNPVAVRLTELRLWLAVIAGDPAESPDVVAPLPNLDCLIRQGDSLNDPLGLLPGPAPAAPALAREMHGARRRLITATGPAKAGAVRRLRQAEIAAATDALERAERGAERAMTECLTAARQADLFGRPRGLDVELRDLLRSRRQLLRLVRAARRRLARDGELPWFHYQSHFADVFARGGGFQLIVGNPPWVRAEQLDPARRRQLAGRYRWWRGSAASGYAHQPDLSVAFVERCLELAAPGGVVALLVPLKLASAGYGARLRQALSHDHTLHVLADLTDDPRATFDATAYPLALVAERRRPPGGQQVGLGLAGGPTVPQQVLARAAEGGGPWIIRGGAPRAALAVIDSLPRLGDELTCHLGVKTGANSLYLDPPDDLEIEVVRWAARGRDITSFGLRRRVRLFWPHHADGRPLARLPPHAARWLAPFVGRLAQRADYHGGPVWTLFRTGPACRSPVVTWPDLARTLRAVPLVAPLPTTIPLNSCYVCPCPTEGAALALATWLNSTWLRATARLAGDVARGGYRRYNARVMHDLPLPPAVLTDYRLADLARRALTHAVPQEDLDAAALRHLPLETAAQNALRAVVARRRHPAG